MKHFWIQMVAIVAIVAIIATLDAISNAEAENDQALVCAHYQATGRVCL